jgi:hypothetical protein
MLFLLFIPFPLVIRFLIYPNTSSTSLSFFVCRNINSEYFLSPSFETRCFDGQWNSFIPFAIVSILVYPLGIPAFFAYLLLRYRQRLEEPGVRLQLGFLYGAYTRGSRFFELVSHSADELLDWL